MSRPAPNTSLSRSARLLFYLGLPSALLLTAIASPRTALLSPVALLPTALCLKLWQAANRRNPSPRGELEPMLWTYLLTGTVGLAGAAVLQMGAGLAASMLLFPSSATRTQFLAEVQRTTLDGLTPADLMSRAQLAASWQVWAMNGLFAFGLAGLVEEALKYLPIAYARRRGSPEQRKPRNRAYLDYAVAGALSFGVVENVLFIYTSCEVTHEPWATLLRTLFERAVGVLGHALVASVTALRAIRRDYYSDQMGWLAVLGPAVLLHGTFDFVAIAFSTLEGNVGWIHPVERSNIAAMYGVLAGLVATAAGLTRREWNLIRERDHRRKLI